MTDHDHALRRLLLEARRPESAQLPSFDRLWRAARTQIEAPQPAPGRWVGFFAGGAATACVLLIALFLALAVRTPRDAEPPDSMLYTELVARTAWRSPTDDLLDTTTHVSLRTLPELPAVNTYPSLESLP